LDSTEGRKWASRQPQKEKKKPGGDPEGKAYTWRKKIDRKRRITNDSDAQTPLVREKRGTRKQAKRQ